MIWNIFYNVENYKKSSVKYLINIIKYLEKNIFNYLPDWKQKLPVGFKNVVYNLSLYKNFSILIMHLVLIVMYHNIIDYMYLNTPTHFLYNNITSL